ncbi:MAG: DUF5335 family protein [Gemmatimonadaceae bacterium]
MEVDRADLGAQPLVDGLPLLSADYDVRGGRVTLGLGHASLHCRQLAHVIPDVTGIDLATDDADAVRVLRIGDAEGADARDVHRLMP